jgi:hypothetical protein
MGCAGSKVEGGVDEPSGAPTKGKSPPFMQADAPPFPRPDPVPPKSLPSERPKTPTPPVEVPQPIVPLPPIEPPKPLVIAPPKPLVVAPPKPLIVSPPKPVVIEPPKPLIVSPPKPAVVEPPKPVVVEPPKPIPPPSPEKPPENELADSVILSELPAILGQFRHKKFELLWRGSRDGFSADAFHNLCDDCPNTMTLILDTQGNIFGGFTPIPWESCCITKADTTMGSFLFTIKNQYDVEPMIFPVKEDKRDFAIFCYEGYGPSFGFPDASDLRIADNCNQENARRTNYAGSFGDTYDNQTKLSWRIGENCFLAGSPFFVVKEIEVFEIPE